MEESTIDRAAMGRLAKALVFVCGPDHPTTMALQAAAGSERDIKNARATSSVGTAFIGQAGDAAI